MQKVLISIPDELAVRMRATIPSRKRSKTIAHLIEEEILKREQDLYNCAVLVEKDEASRHDLKDWDVTLDDGIDNEPW